MALSRATAVTAGVSLCFLISCSRTGLPAVDSSEYATVVSAFYVGLAGLQTGEDTRAKEKLTLATQLAPGEPAAWADLALFTARQQDFEKAAQYAETARSLAPENSAIESLLGAISSKRGKLPEAIDHFRKAVTLDGGNMKARESLAAEIERQSTATSDSEAQAELEKLLAKLPGNLSVQLDVARLAAKRGDAATLRRMVGELERRVERLAFGSAGGGLSCCGQSRRRGAGCLPAQPAGARSRVSPKPRRRPHPGHFYRRPICQIHQTAVAGFEALRSPIRRSLSRQPIPASGPRFGQALCPWTIPVRFVLSKRTRRR